MQLQSITIIGSEALRAACPHDDGLDPMFEQIITAGTDHSFEIAHNTEWDVRVVPMMHAYLQTTYWLYSAVWAPELPHAPHIMPAWWAALACPLPGAMTMGRGQPALRRPRFHSISSRATAFASAAAKERTRTM